MLIGAPLHNYRILYMRIGDISAKDGTHKPAHRQHIHDLAAGKTPAADAKQQQQTPVKQESATPVWQ